MDDCKCSSDDMLEHILQDPNSMPRVMTLEYLKRITDNFSDERLLGKGGFANVYKGKLQNGKMIAVKKFIKWPNPDVQETQFMNEVVPLMRTRHPNIVRCVGYCFQTSKEFAMHNGKMVFADSQPETLLCLEYLTMGSLDKHLQDESSRLDWRTCYKIIKGVCGGLHYLHEECRSQINDAFIVHMDLKPANILLDKNMTAKIGDLGLSRLVSSTKTYQTKAREGTVGYMPPEYINNGDVSRKFDVFSLGVVIIKIMDGNDGNSRRFHMPREQFIEFVANNWKERLQGTLGYSSQEINMLRVKTCIYIALRCVDTEKNKRPYIKDIVNELEELEAKIQKMTLSSDHSKAVILGQQIGHSPILQDLRIEELEKKAAAMARQIEDLQNLVVAMSGQIEDLQKKVDAKP